MRKKKTAIGDTRVISRFLWLPLSLGGETRWLERAAIHQQYAEILVGPWEMAECWTNKAWAKEVLGE